jgi:hypothetical protein
VIAGGLVVSIGCFMPWLTVTVLATSVNRLGVDDLDGLYALYLGIVLVLTGIQTASARGGVRSTKLAITGLASLALVVAVFEMAWIQSRIAAADSPFAALIAAGPGLKATLLGAAFSLAGAVVLPEWRLVGAVATQPAHSEAGRTGTWGWNRRSEVAPASALQQGTQPQSHEAGTVPASAPARGARATRPRLSRRQKLAVVLVGLVATSVGLGFVVLSQSAGLTSDEAIWCGANVERVRAKGEQIGIPRTDTATVLEPGFTRACKAAYPER